MGNVEEKKRNELREIRTSLEILLSARNHQKGKLIFLLTVDVWLLSVIQSPRVGELLNKFYNLAVRVS